MRTAVVLPAPFGPEQPQHRPGRDLEVHAVERADLARSAREHLDQTLSGDGCHALIQPQPSDTRTPTHRPTRLRALEVAISTPFPRDIPEQGAGPATFGSPRRRCPGGQMDRRDGWESGRVALPSASARRRRRCRHRTAARGPGAVRVHLERDHAAGRADLGDRGHQRRRRRRHRERRHPDGRGPRVHRAARVPRPRRPLCAFLLRRAHQPRRLDARAGQRPRRLPRPSERHPGPREGRRGRGLGPRAVPGQRRHRRARGGPAQRHPGAAALDQRALGGGRLLRRAGWPARCTTRTPPGTGSTPGARSSPGATRCGSRTAWRTPRSRSTPTTSSTGGSSTTPPRAGWVSGRRTSAAPRPRPPFGPGSSRTRSATTPTTSTWSCSTTPMPPLDVSGWTVRDSSLTTFTLPVGTVIGPA